jgi:hypothetical protein
MNRPPSPRRRLSSAGLVLLAALCAAASARAQGGAVPFGCPAGPIELLSGTSVQTGACTIRGDLTLGGNALLVIDRAHFVLDGNLSLRGDARLVVQASAFTIDQDAVLERRIEARDRARIDFVGSVVSTNRSTPGASFASQYLGYDQSVLRIVNSQILLPDSWLLADLHGNATVHTTQSTNLPSEIYPHDAATVLIEGANADHRVWLEFVAGAKAVITEIPDAASPFSFAFGRETAGVVNVGYQVKVIGGIATFGLASHPGSDVTLSHNIGPVAIAYFVTDPNATEPLTGFHPGLRNATFTHQGRVLRLVEANLEGFAWQIYAASPGATTPGTVPIADSVLNEIAALGGGRVSVTNSVLQWAVIAALGPRSAIDITGSTINSQSIVAAEDAVIHIDSSDIFGSAVQARDDAVVLLTNTRLGRNVCHALCLPLCPSFANGGCNWFLDSGADMSLEAADRAMIVAAGIDAPAGAISIGANHAFTGDALAIVAPGATASLDYDLRWRNAGTGAGGVIATNGRGPKRGELLGTLATSGFAAGDYFAILALRIGGAPAVTVVRPFKLAAP